MPKYLSALPKCSLIKQAFEGMCINEFKGMRLDASKPGDLATGEQVLDRLKFGSSSVQTTLQRQARILLFNYWITYKILKAKSPKFQKMEAPADRALPKSAY